jgi:hypothetical protein
MQSNENGPVPAFKVQSFEFGHRAVNSSQGRENAIQISNLDEFLYAAQSTVPLLTMDDQVLFLVLRFLGPEELLGAGIVNRFWRQVADSDPLWQKLCKRHKLEIPTLPKAFCVQELKSKPWRWLYEAMKVKILPKPRDPWAGESVGLLAFAGLPTVHCSTVIG